MRVDRDSSNNSNAFAMSAKYTHAIVARVPDVYAKQYNVSKYYLKRN